MLCDPKRLLPICIVKDSAVKLRIYFFEYQASNKQAGFSFSLKGSHFIARVHVPRKAQSNFPRHYFAETTETTVSGLKTCKQAKVFPLYQNEN